MRYSKDTPDWFFPLLMRSVRADYEAAGGGEMQAERQISDTERLKWLLRALSDADVDLGDLEEWALEVPLGAETVSITPTDIDCKIRAEEARDE